MTSDDDKEFWDELSGEISATPEPTNVEHLETKTKPTEKYKAFDATTTKNLSSIILDYCDDGTSRNISYSSLAPTSVIVSSGQKFVTIILAAGNTYTLEGENLKGIQPLIQETQLSTINTFNANKHIKPDDNEPIVYKISLLSEKKEKKSS